MSNLFEEMTVISSDEELPLKANPPTSDPLNALILRLKRAHHVIESQQRQLQSLTSELARTKQEVSEFRPELWTGPEEENLSESQRVSLEENHRLRQENEKLLEKLALYQSTAGVGPSDMPQSHKSASTEEVKVWTTAVMRVTAFMDRTGLKQHALARRVGCSQGTLSSWLKLKYTGDVSRITSRIQSALEILEGMTGRELASSTECVLPQQTCAAQRKMFSRAQLETLEAIARETPLPSAEVVAHLSKQFEREPRHIHKWFSNWRNRKQPRMSSSPEVAGQPGPSTAPFTLTPACTYILPVPTMPLMYPETPAPGWSGVSM